jgi:hypothetical protein
MPDDNKRNLQYFESSSMRDLYDQIQKWQNDAHKRLLSVSIQKDGENFCCIALTNPTEVLITNSAGNCTAAVSAEGELIVWDNCP